MKARVLIADDHAIMREGLKALLSPNDEIEIIGEADSGRRVVEMARELRPDIVVMDVTMAEGNGVEATRRIRAENPSIQVIALSAYTQRQFVVSMLDAGASAYVIKAEASQELMRAFQSVRSGHKYLCPQVADAVSKSYLDQRGTMTMPINLVLSSREREVLQLVAEGSSSPEIAKMLNLSSKTVETHRRNIMQKLGLHTVAELVKYAIREGLSSTET